MPHLNQVSAAFFKAFKNGDNMIKTDFKLQYNTCQNDNGGIPVIIVAAGLSTRMGGTNKQTALLCGIPVIARTLKSFENSHYISRIILVTQSKLILEMQSIAQKYMISKLTDIVEGGADRHASVMCGIERLNDNEDKVLIHDGARPFATEDIISRCVAALQDYDGCLCGVKINDTVKRVDDDFNVTDTLDRSYLYAAQTPQGVSVAAYKSACEKMGDAVFTDDAAVLESAGYSVKLVQGSVRNIKITNAEDLLIAEAFIKGE